MKTVSKASSRDHLCRTPVSSSPKTGIPVFDMLGLMQLTIPTARLRAEAQLPRYAHTGPFGDLAADLHAAEVAELAPGDVKLVPTGLAFEFPAGYGALVEDRSGLAVKGITTLAGVIDPGYRGELKVVITNVGQQTLTIAVGDRIAQLRIVQRIEAEYVEAASVAEAPRGAGGFGSTGV